MRDFTNVDIAVNHAKEMINLGADMIDLGGESTRPGHKFVSAEEEISRIVPVIKRLKEEIDVPISIDTYKSEVAEEALKLGAACGSATAFSNDLATKDYIDRLVNEIEVKNIKYDNVL